MQSTGRLGVNIDHIATLRQLRGTPYPDLIAAAKIVENAGGHQITVHLREDRRHIQDEDVKQLRAALRIPLNLEMAATKEMAKFAQRISPDWACLVPEKRQEVTTEGGLDVVKNKKRVGDTIAQLKKAGVKVSCFIEPDLKAVRMSRELGADAVEFHTGRFGIFTQAPDSSQKPKRIQKELDRIIKAAKLARKIGLNPHAGHGLDLENVRLLAVLEDEGKVPLIEEYNIGHFIVCRAALVGLERAVREMVSAIEAP